MSDDKERAKGNDAYAAFVKGSWDHHLRVARLLTRDPHQAEELLQDCLVKLYGRWRHVSRHGNPQAYLRRMLVNGNVSRWRRFRRELLVAETPERPALHAGPDESQEELRRALLALPRQQRAAVVLRYYADLSEKETAEALGCSVGSVKTHHARALARLHALLPAPSPKEVHHDQR